MKYITGFFMAWGNFLSLPCPCKKWDGDLKNLMLAFLPCVGLIIGAIWTGIYLLLLWLGFPFLAVAFIMTFLPFALCGFMHLDGFMDCCDAILSRKPLEEKQAILKDSHTGAFAVVGVIFLILGFYSFISTAISGGIDVINLCLIPVVSRGFAGVEMIRNVPIGHSQYAQGAGAFDGKQKKTAVALILIQLLIFAGGGMFLSGFMTGTGIVLGATAVGVLISTFWARRRLGGMSGDIAGHGIVWGELLGVFALMIA